MICSDSQFNEVPNRALMSLSFGVTRLTLTRNRFESGNLGPYNFSGIATGMEELVLQECGLTKLQPGVFQSMSRLIYLDLSMNHLRKLYSRQFSMLPVLEVLVLSGNRQLKIDSDTFRGAVASELALDECGLDYLPDDPTAFPNGLRRLYIQDNRLQTIPKQLEPIFVNLEDVRMRGNRWHCDARIQWLIEVFHQRRDAFSDDPVCESPVEMLGRRFSSISATDPEMAKEVGMPQLPPRSISPYGDYDLPYDTVELQTYFPASTVTPEQQSSTIISLNEEIKEEKVPWSIEYPTSHDEMRAREYEAAYEERASKQPIASNTKDEKEDSFSEDYDDGMPSWQEFRGGGGGFDDYGSEEAFNEGDMEDIFEEPKTTKSSRPSLISTRTNHESALTGLTRVRSGIASTGASSGSVSTYFNEMKSSFTPFSTSLLLLLLSFSI